MLISQKGCAPLPAILSTDSKTGGLPDLQEWTYLHIIISERVQIIPTCVTSECYNYPCLSWKNGHLFPALYKRSLSLGAFQPYWWCQVLEGIAPRPSSGSNSHSGESSFDLTSQIYVWTWGLKCNPVRSHKRSSQQVPVTLLVATIRVQELCECRGGRPGLSVLMSLTVSVDVKQHWTVLRLA